MSRNFHLHSFSWLNVVNHSDIGTRADDVLLLGKCDDVVRDLCRELGPEWEAQLDKLWAETEPVKKDNGEKADVKEDEVDTKDEEEKRLQDEVAQITEWVGNALNISGETSHERGETDGRSEQGFGAKADNIVLENADTTDGPKGEGNDGKQEQDLEGSGEQHGKPQSERDINVNDEDQRGKL